MIGSKRRLLTNAVVKARVLSRDAIVKHRENFATQQEVIQKQMMEMQNANPKETIKQQNQQPEQQLIQTS